MKGFSWVLSKQTLQRCFSLQQKKKPLILFPDLLHVSFPSFTNSCCIKVLVLEPFGKSRISNR